MQNKSIYPQIVIMTQHGTVSRCQCVSGLNAGMGHPKEASACNRSLILLQSWENYPGAISGSLSSLSVYKWLFRMSISEQMHMQVHIRG